MDETLTDRDQEERLFAFLRENWRWMLAGIVLGIAGLIGWNKWQEHTRHDHEAAAAEYTEVLKVLTNGDTVKAKTMVEDLAANHPNSPYADQGRLLLARVHVDRGRFDEAATLLRTVADKSKDQELVELAQIRLARVLLASGKHAEALAALQVAEASAYQPLAHEIRGDVHYAQGKMNEARAAYAAALEGDSAVIDRSFLELKLQQVGGKADAPAPATQKVAP